MGLQMEEAAARAIEPATQAALAAVADVPSEDVLITGYSADGRRLGAAPPEPAGAGAPARRLQSSTRVDFAIVAADTAKLESCSDLC